MTDEISGDRLFRDATDLFVMLSMDRKVKIANPAFLRETRGRVGLDFLDLAEESERSRIASELARAAGGTPVLFKMLHEASSGQKQRYEWNFFPVEGGLVAGVGRAQAERPALVDQLGRAKKELREKTRTLDHIQLELTQVPFTDTVTGVLNRFQVYERCTGEWSRCKRYGSPLACLIAKIEDFDAMRTKNGTYVGDEVMNAVRRRLEHTVRDHDILGRYRDDRFVILAVADADGVRALGGRMRAAVASEPVVVGDRHLAVSIRIGDATDQSEGVEIMEDLFSVAESALDEPS